MRMGGERFQDEMASGAQRPSPPLPTQIVSEKWKWKSLSRVQLFATPWTIQSMEFSRPEYCSGWPFPPPGDFPNPGIETTSPELQMDSLPAELSDCKTITKWFITWFYHVN